MTEQTMFSLFTLALFIFIFYFFLIKPQQKARRDRKAMMDALKVDDNVYTYGGLIGSIVEINEEKDYVILEVDNDVEVMVLKSGIAGVRNKD